jgi:predicted HAD superfamily Cof-like phosphohydrolase
MSEGLTPAFRDVAAFMRAMDQTIEPMPTLPDRTVRMLRVNLIFEECQELLQAEWTGNLAGIADALADLTYVILGMALAYGIDLPAVWEAVQEANMAKVNGPVRADGKRLKSSDWVPPDVAGILDRQSPITETYL